MKTPKRSKRSASVKSASRKRTPRRNRTYEDLDIGDEQVTSNECWDLDEPERVAYRVYRDLQLGEEQVTSNECYDVKEG